MEPNAEATLTVDQQFIRDELHKQRTDFTSALADFATQADLDAMVKKVADGAVTAAKDAIADLRKAQEQWQDEQRQKLDAFILEVRSKLDTYAPVSTVESLRTKFEDSHRHFASITGTHGEAIDTLKKELAEFKKQTNGHIESIKASAANIDTRTDVMQKSVMQLIDANKEYRATVTGRLDALTAEQKELKQDIERVEEDQRKEAKIFQDTGWRVETSMEKMQAAVFGEGERNKPGYKPGLVENVGLVLARTAWQGWITRHPRLAFMGFGASFVGLVLAVAFILGRPEVIGAFVQAAMRR